jgi:hypothetical protein
MPQVPITRAIQQDEEAIERWRSAVWPELRRRARRERRVPVFKDESGFYLLPGTVRTYAPEGLTPVLREKADARSPLRHGRDDAAGPGLHYGTAGVVEWAALRRVPPALAPRGGGTSVGDLGRFADPSPGGGQGVRVRHARSGMVGGPAGIRPRSEPLSSTKNYGGNFDLCGFVSITTAGVLPPSFMPISMSWSRW